MNFVKVVVAVLLLVGCGRGDGETHITNGYYFHFSGGNNNSIIYRGGNTESTRVIHSKVEQFLLFQGNIFVARRPLELFKVEGILKSRLLDKCEYWYIDVIAHRVMGPYTEVLAKVSPVWSKLITSFDEGELRNRSQGYCSLVFL